MSDSHPAPRQPQQPRRQRGRPTRYTDAIASEVCARLANGESLRGICESEHMPADSTVIAWALEDRSGFAERYAQARRIQAERWIEEIVSIADDRTSDTFIDADGITRTNHEVVARSRLRVDTRKWIACKVLPKVYGDAVKIEHTGKIELADELRKARERAAGS